MAVYRRGMDESLALVATGSGSAGESEDWEIGDWFTPRPSRPLHSTRCEAISRTSGQRCRKWAVIGFSKCSKHSGVAQLTNLAQYRERVIEAARLQLLEAAGDAIETLIRIRDDEAAPPAVRIKAASELLDRAGVHRGAELTISASTSAGPSPSEIIRERLNRLAAASQRDRDEAIEVDGAAETVRAQAAAGEQAKPHLSRHGRI